MDPRLAKGIARFHIQKAKTNEEVIRWTVGTDGLLRSHEKTLRKRLTAFEARRIMDKIADELRQQAHILVDVRHSHRQSLATDSYQSDIFALLIGKGEIRHGKTNTKEDVYDLISVRFTIKKRQCYATMRQLGITIAWHALARFLERVPEGDPDMDAFFKLDSADQQSLLLAWPLCIAATSGRFMLPTERGAFLAESDVLRGVLSTDMMAGAFVCNYRAHKNEDPVMFLPPPECLRVPFNPDESFVMDIRTWVDRDKLRPEQLTLIDALRGYITENYQSLQQVLRGICFPEPTGYDVTLDTWIRHVTSINALLRAQNAEKALDDSEVIRRLIEYGNLDLEEAEDLVRRSKERSK